MIDYAAPTRVGALVVPAGALKVAQYFRYFDRLLEASDVPLKDVKVPNATKERSLFSPQPDSWRLKFNFSGKPVLDYYESLNLYDLEPWRRQFVVVGIVHYSELIAQENKDDYLEDALKKLEINSPMTIYQSIFVFGAPNDYETKVPHAFVVYKSNWSSVETAVNGLTGEFLGKLSEFWQERKMSSFKASNEVAMDLNTNSSISSDLNNPQMKPKSKPDAKSSRNRKGQINMDDVTHAKILQEGRTRKYLGQLYLLAGNVHLALAELGAASAILKTSQDYAWLGSALDGIGLCLVIQKFQNNKHSAVPLAAVQSAWAIALRIKNANATGLSALTGSIGLGGSTHSSSGGSHHHSGSISSVSGAASASHSSINGTHHARASSTSSIDSSATSQTVESSASSSFPSVAAASSASIGNTSGVSIHKSKPFTEHTPIDTILSFLVTSAIEYLVDMPVCYNETVFRYVNLLICLRRGNGWTEVALSAAICGTSLTTTDKCMHLGVSIHVIQDWLSKIYSSLARTGNSVSVGLQSVYGSSESANPLTTLVTLGTLNSLARVYVKAGLQRKWAFTCASILALLATCDRNNMHFDSNSIDLDGLLKMYKNWPGLEVGTLRTLVSLGQKLKNPQMQTEAASRLLEISNRSQSHISDKEQLTLYHLIRSYGDVVQCSFWDPDMVLSVSVKAHTHTKSSAAAQSQSRNSGILFNPFNEVIKEDSVEAGVLTHANIFVRNFLSIELPIFELVLEDENGNQISQICKDIVIPAKSARYKIEVPIIPSHESKELVITNCLVQVNGCVTMNFNVDRIGIVIIPARPVLVLQELSLYKGWSMLLQGERRQFTLSLWNSSEKTESKHISFKFQDNTSNSYSNSSGFNAANVSKMALYEYENFLNQKVCRLISESDGIAPLHSQQYSLEMFGKRGVSSASILVDYGHSEDSLRRLKIPIQLTVFQSISVEGVNLLPTRSGYACNKNTTHLLVLDLQNMWRHPLTVVCGTESEEIEHEIRPNEVKRFLIPICWEIPSLTDLELPIPMGKNKQFIVDKKTSKEQLHIFWLREKLLNMLHGTWKDKVNNRSGEIELRKIHLTDKMASMLMFGAIELKMSSESGTNESSSFASTVKHPIDTPVSLSIEITNKHSVPITGILKLIPGKTASEFMLNLGYQQRVISVGGQESVKVDFKVLFLTPGSYEMSSVLDIEQLVFQMEKFTIICD